MYQSTVGKYYVGQTVCPKLRQRAFHKLSISYGVDILPRLKPRDS